MDWIGSGQENGPMSNSGLDPVSVIRMANTGKVFFIADLPFQTRDPIQPT